MVERTANGTLVTLTAAEGTTLDQPVAWELQKYGILQLEGILNSVTPLV